MTNNKPSRSENYKLFSIRSEQKEANSERSLISARETSIHSLDTMFRHKCFKLKTRKHVFVPICGGSEGVWKIKVSILWLFRDLAALTILVLWFMQPGALEGIMAGEVLGAQITPETMTFLGMQFWAPLAMAFLSLTLKDKPNRLANIIVGTIYTVLSAYGLIGVSVQEVLLRVSATVATALIVWYAWKSRKEGGSL